MIMVAEQEEILIQDLSIMARDLTITQLRNLYQECLNDNDIALCEIIKVIMSLRDSNL
jgi:hypothetical protein